MARLTGRGQVSRAPLFVASVLFFISWYVPSPLLRGVDTNFMTHVVGGGLFTGFLWLYLSRALGAKQNWWQSLIMMYVLVSALGVANELFEFAAVEAGWAHIGPSDTWWDLLANNLGVFVFWVGYRMYAALKFRG